MADTLSARPAVDRELLYVRLAFVAALVVGPARAASALLQSVQLLGHLEKKELQVYIITPFSVLLNTVNYLFNPSAVDQFGYVQRRPAVRALRPLLRQPPPDAEVAAQLGAVGTQVSVLQLLHANEASGNVS